MTSTQGDLLVGQERPAEVRALIVAKKPPKRGGAKGCRKAKSGKDSEIGYSFQQGLKLPSEKAKKRFLQYIKEKTPSSCGYSLRTIIEELNQTIIGWFAYFKHSKYTVFRELDGKIRRRLRGILHRRQKISGWAYTPENKRRWPNAYFAKAGLYSMAEARRRELESLRKGTR